MRTALGAELRTRRELSLKERLAYLELGLRAETGLEEAIRLLSLRELEESNPADLERLYLSLRRLDGAWLDVHADLISFLSGDLRVRPPAPSLTRRVVERAALLSKLLPDALPSVVLTLAGDIIDQWDETQPADRQSADGRSWTERLPVTGAAAPKRAQGGTL